MTQSSTTPALRDENSLRSVGRWLDLFGPALALLVVFVFFWAVIGPRFVHYNNNIITILSQSAIVAMAALGMTFIIGSGGIDLSTGSNVALSCVVVAVILNVGVQPDDPGDPAKRFAGAAVMQHPILWPILAAVAGVLTGTLAGALNGVLSAGLRIVPFIVTLGSMMMYRAMAKHAAHETKVYPPEKNWLASLLNSQSEGQTFGTLLLHPWRFFPVGIWIVIALAILMALVLRYTRFGRHVLAIGSNEQTARLCGIQVTRQRIYVYALGGLFAGLASVLQYARTVQGDPTSATGLELNVIAAVVIGGASLNGGRASIFGTLVGALFMNVVQNGCQFVPLPKFLQDFFNTQSALGMPSYVQEFLTGAIIIIAALLDNFRRKRTA